MNWIDILLVAIILVAAWNGWQKGFLNGLAELVAWLGSLAVAFLTYQPISNYFKTLIPEAGAWTQPAVFIIIMILVRSLFALISARTPAFIRTGGRPAFADRLFGIVPGLINGGIYAIVAAALILGLSSYRPVAEPARTSLLLHQLEPQVLWANEQVAPVFEDLMRETEAARTLYPKPDETVQLPFKVDDVETRADLEKEMLALVNEEREKAGLPRLKADPEMSVVARAHARDMFARGYFSHYSPERTDPFERMKAMKLRFRTAGENLALGQSLKSCHTGLMNSPGHRANILQPAFGRLGIGIVDGGIYGLMIAQEFRN